MTFRQIANALWQRRILIIVVVALAVVISVVFLARQTPVYSSSITVRLNSLSTSASTSGQIGTTAVDFDAESISSPAVLSAAAKLVNGLPADALNGHVTHVVTAGTPPNKITITATGPTPTSATARAAAVAKAYNAYLQSQYDKALKAAQAQAAQATADAQQYQTQVTQNPANSIAQSNLATALKSLETANGLVAKITSSGPPLTVLVAASPGAFKGVSPLVAVGVALVAGLVAGIGIALIRDQFDNRLRGEHELRDLTDAPSLGELSLDRRVERRHERLPTADRKRTPLNEGLRALRTTLQVLLPASGAVIVFTSVEPGDGKTFVSANLALAWARTGKRVILVGGDLRRPNLGEYYGEAGDGPGLTELLQLAAHSGKALQQEQVEGFLHTSTFHGLRVLPAGGEPHAPADLLATAGLGVVFDALRALSDIVVVDSPPSMALVDASLLAARADGAVLVATIGRTNRDHLSKTVEALESNNAIVLGVVANRSRRRIPRSYGAYYGRRKNLRINQRSRPEEPEQSEESELTFDMLQPIGDQEFELQADSTHEESRARPAGRSSGTRSRKPQHPVAEDTNRDGAGLSPGGRNDA